MLISLPSEKYILEGIKDHLQKQYAIQAVTIYQDFTKPDGAKKFYDQCKKLQKQVYYLFICQASAKKLLMYMST